MSNVVLDSSAVLAVLNQEPGASEVEACLPGAWLSAVNAAEVAAKMVIGGTEMKAIDRALEGVGARIMPFQARDVLPSARFLSSGHNLGRLSLGDRACLSLALRLGVPAVTADRIWKELDTGVEVRLIR